MLPYFRLCNMVYWLALIVWISALVSAGLAAVNVFGAMDDLPLTLEAYPEFPAVEHGRIAAGKIMSGVFFSVDLLQFVAVPLVVLTLVVHLTIFRTPWRSASNLLRTLCIAIAAMGFGWHVIRLAPTMNRHLHQFWKAAEAGEIAVAEAHRASFNHYHPTAQNIMQLNLLLLITAASASAIALGSSFVTGVPRDAPALRAS